jgi:hypothetical protein
MIQNNSYGLCLECNEGIFNPICPACLAREMRIWIEENGFNRKIGREISEFANSIKNKFIDEGIDCAICKSNQTSICPYCFTSRIYNFLQKLNVKRKILEEFLTYFNYDFEHTGYSEDFEEEFGN